MLGNSSPYYWESFLEPLKSLQDSSFEEEPITLVALDFLSSRDINGYIALLVFLEGPGA